MMPRTKSVGNSEESDLGEMWEFQMKLTAYSYPELMLVW